MPGILGVSSAFPRNYYTQAELSQALLALSQRRDGLDAARVKKLFAAVKVEGRHLALPLERYAELSALEREVDDLNERLAARKAIDRAKALLQDSLGLSEPDAFGWIQRTAMDLRTTMHSVAERILEHGVDDAQPPR